MIKTKCDACEGEYDPRYMIIQDEKTIYCPCCDYENSAKLDAKDEE